VHLVNSEIPPSKVVSFFESVSLIRALRSNSGPYDVIICLGLGAKDINYDSHAASNLRGAASQPFDVMTI